MDRRIVYCLSPDQAGRGFLESASSSQGALNQLISRVNTHQESKLFAVTRSDTAALFGMPNLDESHHSRGSCSDVRLEQVCSAKQRAKAEMRTPGFDQAAHNQDRATGVIDNFPRDIAQDISAQAAVQS